MTPGGKRKKLSYENHLFLLTLLSGLPALLLLILLLWKKLFSPQLAWTVAILMGGLWLGFAVAVRERVVRPLHTLSNLLAALREEDFSIRARRSKPGDALDEVIVEVNALSTTLREQRLGAIEASALLRRVMEETDVVILAFDDRERLCLINRAGERLLGHPAERVLERTAAELNLAVCLSGDANQVLELPFAGSVGRWDLRRSAFRQAGRPHQLLVLADLSRTLRDEERRVWQRLIRVIGHELNNSLAPIQSIAGSLQNLLKQDPLPVDWKDDAQQGLSVIASRAEALSRFMQAYARLARLPQPQMRPLQVEALLKRAASLETRMPVAIAPGPQREIQGDEGQLEQLLINLLRNAVDAALETGGKVEMGWSPSGSQLEIWIEDEGPGLSGTANLFVPFFTTKSGGTGIGLVLSRQIAEAHGGTLALKNRVAGTGCRASLLLPAG